MSTNITALEDFPSLPAVSKMAKTVIKTEEERNRSCYSSESLGCSDEESEVSEETVYECPQVFHKLEKGTYYLKEDAFARFHLDCRCEFCWDLKKENSTSYIRAGEWDSCLKKRFLKKGDTVKVTKSKVVYHREDETHEAEKFSVAYVKVEGKNKHGWVQSKFLKHRAILRSESVMRDAQRREEIDRSRANSVCSVTTAYSSQFQLGELVQVRIETGSWVTAVIRDKVPYIYEGVEYRLVLLEGETEVCYFDSGDIQKYPAKDFIAMTNLEVRSNQAVDRWSIGSVKKGSIVKIAYCEGAQARITYPMAGWITIRTKHSLNVLEKTWTESEIVPSVLVYGITGNMTEADLVEVLQQSTYVTPVSINFQAKDGMFRALVEVSGYESGKSIVDVGNVSFTNGEKFSFKWYLPYLKSFTYNRFNGRVNRRGTPVQGSITDPFGHWFTSHPPGEGIPLLVDDV